MIGSKWTWLTAQISDLEYRIRQQNDLVRQIRSLKGPVTLGEPVIFALGKDRHVDIASNVDIDSAEQKKSSATSELSREFTEVFDSLGRKIIIKEPISPLKNSETDRKIQFDKNDEYKDRPVVDGSSTPSKFKSLSKENSQVTSNIPIGSSRTRPLLHLRRRCILPTKGLYRSSARAAKESTVRCDCIHPLYSCAICFGRSNHTQAPDPVFQDRARTISLLDHSYHQVLSNSKSDVPLGLLIMQRLKNRSWMAVASAGSRDQDTLSSGVDNKRETSLSEKERRKEERRLKKLAAKAAAIASGQIEDTKSKNRKKYAAAKKRKLERELEMELEEEGLLSGEITTEVLEAMMEERRRKIEAKKASKTGVNSSKRRNSEGSNKEARKKRLKMLANNEKIRRKSVTVHHQADGNIHAMTDLAGGNGDEFEEIEASSVTSSSLPSPSVHGIHQLPTMEQIRRKRETAFDIDNIVIPYSTMASARVEKLKYKEIQTPVWRVVDEEFDIIQSPPDETSIHKDLEEDKAESGKVLGSKTKDHSGLEEIKGEISDNRAELVTHKSLMQLDTESSKKDSTRKSLQDIEEVDEKTEITKLESSQNQLDKDDKPCISSIKQEMVGDANDQPKTNIINSIANDQGSTESDIKDPENLARNMCLSKESENIEDISNIFYENRHRKAEIEEQIRWRTPLWKSSGGQRAVHRSISSASSTGVRESRESMNITLANSSVNFVDGNPIRIPAPNHSGSGGTGQRTNQRQDSRSGTADKAISFETGGSLSSGCNTPDPLSPSMVEKVDTLEVSTRPSTPTDSSTPINPESSIAANLAASIRNRRRTSSATRSRDRNPSEDASASATSTAAQSRCTTPVDQQPPNVVVRQGWHASGSGAGNWNSALITHTQAHLPTAYSSYVEIRPFEPREFPLSDEKYNSMLKEDRKQVKFLAIFLSGQQYYYKLLPNIKINLPI